MRVKDLLAHQRAHKIEENAYKFIQCDFAYNSNHIEGSTLTHDQTVTIFDRGLISGVARLDDAIEARNHFDLLDHIIDTCDDALSSTYVKELHAILKRGTSDEGDPFVAVGDFKRIDNEIQGEITRIATASPSDVPKLIDDLLSEYERGDLDQGDHLSTMAELHWRFERIHPFSDGNGRVGRAILFKESLRNDETPFIVTEDLREFYIRGLRNYPKEHGWLVDTFGTCQDRFAASYLPLLRSYERAIQAIGIERNERLSVQAVDARAARADARSSEDPTDEPSI